uniref:Uncharacterized protein n=1 Tax=Mus spicilegus TaxID=10103 RepID=A0A8C6GVT9_MUSSI
MQEPCHFWLWRWKEVCDESSPETGTLGGMAFPSDTLRWTPSCLCLDFDPIEPTSDFPQSCKGNKWVQFQSAHTALGHLVPAGKGP